MIMLKLWAEWTCGLAMMTNTNGLANDNEMQHWQWMTWNCWSCRIMLFRLSVAVWLCDVKQKIEWRKTTASCTTSKDGASFQGWDVGEYFFEDKRKERANRCPRVVPWTPHLCQRKQHRQQKQQKQKQQQHGATYYEAKRPSMRTCLTPPAVPSAPGSPDKPR